MKRFHPVTTISWKEIQYILLYLLLFIMPISYHPVIMRMSEAAGYESGTILSRYILVLFALLFMVSVMRMPKMRSVLLEKYLIWTFFIGVMGFLMAVAYSNTDILHSLRTFFIVFASLFIGWTLKPTRKELTWILLVFSLTILFSGLMQVLINIGGFRIAQLYLADSKNSLGAMLASAEVAFLYIFVDQDNKWMRIMSLGCAFLGLIIILTIRARAALLCVFLVGLYMLIYNSRMKKILPWIIGGGVIVIVGSFFLPVNFFDYLEQSMTAGTQGDDITSGRLHTYISATKYILSHPLVGDVMKETEIYWIHNFPLLNLYNYGIVFAWPTLCLYLYLIVYAIRYSLKTKIGYPYAGYTIIFVPYIISLLEPTFPFGPGTVTVFNFILFGASDRYRKLTYENKKLSFKRKKREAQIENS